ncbi:MAG: methionine ABC transporter ATP-binding protein [Solobacterium sp.]|nr:methionine ABC transporter ATP-binding protein [Solobacterium sp.]
MIEIKNVCKNFGDLSVLKDISMTIKDKEIYGIIGQSGAGKSTLLRCVNGLEDYQSGEILIDGVAINQKDKNLLRQQQKQMGMIFQNFNLLKRLTVYENVALPMKFWGIDTKSEASQKKIMDLLKLVGLEQKKDARPSELSGGQQQRVAIARALVLDPKILLCDEATSALDPAITREILSLLQEINQKMGITILVVTHQMEVVKQICERVSFLRNGTVLAEGKPEELFVHPIKEVKAFLQEESALLPHEGVNIQLFFTDKTDEPIITMMARDLNIDFSIVWAKLEDFRSSVYGSLVINIKKEDQYTVLEYLDKVGVSWEVLK